jgi:hypothetical protein
VLIDLSDDEHMGMWSSTDRQRLMRPLPRRTGRGLLTTGGGAPR